jgi:hypothetical protein
MRQTILPSFTKFPDEGAIIGRLVTGYAEIEISLLHCISTVRDDLDTALKIMFRDYGETRRLNVADSFGRQYFNAYQLGTEFAMAMGAARHCLKIRNQFAHCSLYDDNSGKLALVNLEELAKQNVLVTDLKSLTIHHVDVPLLQEMEQYFVYTDSFLLWLNCECRYRAGKIRHQIRSRPKQISQPPLHLP